MSHQLAPTSAPPAAAAGRHASTTPALSRFRGNPWWILVSVALGVIMIGLDGSVVAIANPAIGADLGASLADLQWITNSYLLALATLLIFGGKLGDRYGRRNLFILGIVGFALTSLAIGVVGSTAGVIAFRALQGVFGAMLMPNTLGLIRASFPPEKLNLAIGIWGGASAVSVAAGPIVGGLLVEHVNWESVFFINLPIGALALLVGLLVLPRDPRPADHHRMDLPGIATLIAGLVAIVFGLIKAPEWGWDSTKTLGLLAAGVIVLVAFVAVERRSQQPLLSMHLFRNRSLTISTVLVLVNFFAMFGVLFFVTLYLQSVQGYSPVDAGVRLLPLTLTLMLSAPLGGVLTERLGPRPPMVIGLVAVGASLLAMTNLEVDSSFTSLWPPFLALGIGMGFVLTASSEAIVGNAPADDAGVAGGLQSTAMQLGGVLGTAVLGSVLSSRVGSVLFDNLVGAGTPADLAHQLEASEPLVSQGLAAPVPGASEQLQAAVTAGSHAAFMSGLHTAMVVAGVVTLVAAFAGLFVRRGENTGGPVVVAH